MTKQQLAILKYARKKHIAEVLEYGKSLGLVLKEPKPLTAEQTKKHNAQRLAYKTLKAKKPCIVCKDTEVHRHHYDYNKPLDIIWLCPFHHQALHNYKNRARAEQKMLRLQQ